MNKRHTPPVYGNLYYSLRELTKKVTSIFDEINYKNKNSSHLKVLDFGCGSKPYKEHIESFGFKYLGADIASIENVDIIINETGILEIEGNSVDVVLSSQVLEHIYDFDKYLKECYRVLKPNGYLIISTHGHWCYHPDPFDYWRWTSFGLKKVLERNGFNILKFEGIMNLTSVALQYIQDRTRGKLRYKLPITIYTYFFQCLIRLNEKITKKNCDNDASIFVVLVQKPLV